MSINDINLLLKSSKIADSKDINNIRNNTLLELIYGTGLRVSELVSMPVSAINKNSEIILIKGKGKKGKISTYIKFCEECDYKLVIFRDKMKTKENSKNICFQQIQI